MHPHLSRAAIVPSFPRYFRIGGYWVNAYKLLLCVGIYTGTLVSAAVAQVSGMSPLRMGVGCVSCAFLGIVGARMYYLILLALVHGNERLWAEMWNPERGGGAVFGGLLIVPWSFWLADWLRIPVASYWDHMIFGIVAGAVWIRFGCVCNGCCGGKPTTKWYGVRQRDMHGTRERRIPVPWLEIGWWLLAGAGLLWLWPHPLPPGSLALGTLGWYGVGRFWLEPLREESDLVAGRVRINQVVAALLALMSGGVLIFLS